MDTGNGESQLSSSGRRRGGWITFPFISVAVAGSGIAIWGLLGNLIVYLINEFHVKNIDAAQISNVVSGCASLSPVIGAILADTFGCFPIISISYCISLLATVLLTLTATLHSLSPQPCDQNASSLCETPSRLQFGVLYSALALATIGIGGTRYNLATIGANQFDKTKEQGIFFNWFFFTLYASAVLSSTGVVYIQDNVSWGWGFGICLAANFIGLAVFLLGSQFYRHDKPKQSPFARLASVLVAAIRKRKILLSAKPEDYHREHDQTRKVLQTLPENNFRFLNRAAMKTEGDVAPDGSVAKRWSICSVQEVEDFKRLIKIFPLWSSGLLLSIPIAIQGSMVVLQTLTMDRHLSPRFKIPAGSFPVLVLISASISFPIIDRFLLPAWQKLTGRLATPIQRIGVGHVLTILSMAVSAIVESKRLKTVHSHHLQDQVGAIVPMLALWLLPQLVLVGVGEAFQFPGQVAFYYQEFPASLKGTSTGVISLNIAIGFYLGTALIDFIRRVTGWLPDNINTGRVDNMYWVLVVVGLLNFGYFLVCAWFYKYQINVEETDESSGYGK